MKKLLLVCLALMFISSVLFADDAKVMPARVGRLYIAPIIGSASAKYDHDGNKDPNFDKISFFNLGFALEYGVIDWITAAVQWTPGVTLSSDILGGTGALKPVLEGLGTKVNMNDSADLFVGGKFQIIGKKAPVTSQGFRLAIAAGVLIPLTSGPDYSEELAPVFAAMAGAGTPPSSVTLNSMDNHSFGAGWRAYFDILLGEKFFINFYNETIFYLQKKDLFKYNVGHAAADASTPGGLSELAGTINYQYKTTFEFEPVFETTFGPSIGFCAGLPVNFVSTPKYIYEYDSAIGQAIAGMAGIQDGFSHQSLKITPGVQVFFYKTPLPIELKAQYAIPLYVRNGTALNNLIFQLRIYFMI